MNFKEYEDTVLKHAFYPGKGTVAGLSYTTLGLTGEAGEVANKVKKILRDAAGERSEAKTLEIIDELGDVLWYIAAAADELGSNLDVIVQYNIQKLRDRHGKKEGNWQEGEDGVVRDGLSGNKIEPKLKFKVGDRVVVRDKIKGHQFHIGTLGLVDEVNTAARSYRVKNGFGELWWLSEYELGSLETETENIRHIRSKPFPF